MRSPFKNGRHWPLVIVAMLLGNVCICAVTVYSALSDGGARVERSYASRELAWDDSDRQRALSAALGWSATVDVNPADNAAVLTLRDAEGRPVRSARVMAELVPPGRVLPVVFIGQTGRDGSVMLEPRLERPGAWRARVVADAVGMRFTSESDVIVAEPQVALTR